MDEKTQNLSFLLGEVEPHQMHQCLRWTHLPPQTAAQSLHEPLQLCNKSLFVTIRRETFTPKIAPSHGWSPPVPTSTTSIDYSDAANNTKIYEK